MNAKITRKRLGDLLAYDWIKIIACIAAAVVAWSLIFTVAAVRVKTGQNFGVFVYGETFVTGDDFYDFTDGLRDKLSYDVLEIDSQTVPSGNYASQVLEARASTHEGDLLFVDDADTGTDAPAGDSLFRYMVDRYSMMSYDDLLLSAETYLAKFFDGEGNMDEAAVEQNFRARMKKDNRFRRESAKKEGLEREKERLETLRGDVVWFRALLAEDARRAEEDKIFAVYKKYDQMKAADPDNADSYPETEAARYGLKMDKLEFASKLVKNASGNADKVCLAVFDYAAWQPDLQYETITAIRYLVETYGNIQVTV